MRLSVLTWNLFHGRAVPDVRRELLPEFAAALAGWEWDLALLQEVPPWWPEPLASGCGASERHVLTSRNAALPVRRALGRRRPELIKSNGGGCNAILARPGTIIAHRTLRLCRLPERRWMHAVRLEVGGGVVWVGNLHASGRDAAARRDGGRAGSALLGWAAREPALLGGDFNGSAPSVAGLALAGGRGVDHFLLSRGLRVLAPVRVPAGDGSLSDHDPVCLKVEVEPQPRAELR